MQKDYRYKKQENQELDRAFEQAQPYGRLKLADQYLFWKKGFSWYVTKLDQVVRAYRRVEEVDADLCCGQMNLNIQYLVLVLQDRQELVLRIGDGVQREAEQLFEALKQKETKILFGKA